MDNNVQVNYIVCKSFADILGHSRIIMKFNGYVWVDVMYLAPRLHN